MLGDVGILEQQKVGNQGRDGSIKWFNIQPPTYLFSLYSIMERMSVGGLYTKQIYAIIPTDISFITCNKMWRY